MTVAGGSVGGSSGATDGGAGAGGTNISLGCPGTDMVLVATSGMPPYCVDAHEVSRATYLAFVDAAISVEGQPAYCAWNDSYMPDLVGSPLHDGKGCELDATLPNNPVVCVDWCDARAYCAWTGKRLCSAKGGNPLNVSFDDDPTNDPKRDEWFNACGGGEYRAYPYGPAHKAGHCNDGKQANPLGAPWGVNGTSCEGGVPGLFDMVGNVAEWEGACFGPLTPDAVCARRGGSFDGDSLCVQANGGEPRSIQSQRTTVGIRCCADAVEQ